MAALLAASACPWGLSGLVAGELTKLVLRECWMPCTMDVWRWWPYESDGFRSTPRSGLELPLLLLLATTTTGVCERGEMVRPDVVSARPRATEGPEGAAGAEGGGSIWCDECASGEEPASGTRVSSAWLEQFGCLGIHQWPRPPCKQRRRRHGRAFR